MSHIHFDPRAQGRNELRAQRALLRQPGTRESLVFSALLGLGCFAMSALVAAAIVATYPF